QVFSFSSSSGTMNVAHGSSLNNDFVLHPYIVSESRELFFHLILQVARKMPGGWKPSRVPHKMGGTVLTAAQNPV
ncbi:SH3 domain-containing protein, partial [Candidatus Darwinibacter acetoxidans]